MIESLIESASTFSGQIDGLILLIAAIVFFWFFIAQGVLFYFIFKFRAKDGRKSMYITGDNPKHKRWITVPHILIIVCDVFVIVGAIMVWYNVKQSLPEPDRIVRVIGQQWAWTFVHPGPDEQIDTPDDIVTIDELHVEKDKVYHFKLESRDVLYSLSVPVFRLKQDAIPGREITGWFEATKEGTFDFQCAEMCGIGHGMMAATVTVESPESYQAWQTKNAVAK